jgi:hypothetical protein
LAEAKKRGIRQLLLGLKKIVSASTAKHQFEYLLHCLESAGLIQLSGKANFRIVDVKHAISTMHIQPVAEPGNDVITYAELANFVRQQSDSLSQGFAHSLLEWANNSSS